MSNRAVVLLALAALTAGAFISGWILKPGRSSPESTIAPIGQIALYVDSAHASALAYLGVRTQRNGDEQFDLGSNFGSPAILHWALQIEVVTSDTLRTSTVGVSVTRTDLFEDRPTGVIPSFADEPFQRRPAAYRVWLVTGEEFGPVNAEDTLSNGLASALSEIAPGSLVQRDWVTFHLTLKGPIPVGTYSGADLTVRLPQIGTQDPPPTISEVRTMADVDSHPSHIGSGLLRAGL